MSDLPANPEQPAATASAAPRRDPEFWIAIGALAISALAMFSSVLQVTVQRSQERAAVWPYLDLGASYSAESFSYIVQNKGMGPALVRQVEVFLDGQLVAGWPGVLDGLFGSGHPYGWNRISATQVQDRVLASGERVTVFSIPWASDEAARAAFADASRFQVRACYCSVLGDCWITRPGIDHQAIERCPKTPP
ncbi:MAG: hypothetical protein MUE46_16205 [Xanthomonadales bacterium]|nr:hypothetical protein [Xanthomonadales bacterium]